MALQGIRKFLTDNGINDQDVGYDNGRVTVKGKGFINANPQAQDDPTQGLMKDNTYANPTELSNALKQYRASDRSAQLNNTIDSIGQKAAAQPFQFQQTQKPFQYDASNDPSYQAQKANIAMDTQRDMNNARVDAGAVGMRGGSLQNNQLMQLSAKNESRLQNEVLPNAMARAYQQYQDQNNNDYRTALANYQAQQDQVKNLTGYAGLISGQAQQEFQNDQTIGQAERQKQQDHIALAQTLSDRYGVNVNPTEDPSQSYAQVKGLTPMAMQQYLQQKAAQEAGFTGQYNGQDTEQKKSRIFGEGIQSGQLGISRQNAATSAFSAANSANNASANLKLNQAKFDYEKDPNNPDNKYKLDQLTARNDQTMYDNGLKAFKETGEMPNYMEKYGINVKGLKNEKTKEEVQGLYGDLSSGKMSPEKAIQTIDAAEKLGLKDPEVIDQLRKTIYLQFPEYDPTQIAAKKEKTALPNKFGHRMFGG